MNIPEDAVNVVFHEPESVAGKMKRRATYEIEELVYNELTGEWEEKMVTKTAWETVSVRNPNALPMPQSAADLNKALNPTPEIVVVDPAGKEEAERIAEEIKQEIMDMLRGCHQTMKPLTFWERLCAWFRFRILAKAARFGAPHSLQAWGEASKGYEVVCACGWRIYVGDASELPPTVKFNVVTKSGLWAKVRMFGHRIWHFF